MSRSSSGITEDSGGKAGQPEQHLKCNSEGGLKKKPTHGNKPLFSMIEGPKEGLGLQK